MTTITLREPIKPVTRDGINPLTALTLRRPKVKDLRMMAAHPGTDADKEVSMIAALASLVPEDLNDLDAEDYGKCQEFLSDCLRPRKGDDTTPAA